ncbi:MAG TPA: rhodanese-like domain-containing protein [Microthrixaceae bacterium]|nr:rhodanese-like domain-containing protein [Microthrixaceae bacterium]
MISEVNVEELESLLDGGAELFDVRMPDEFEQAHVPTARLIPLPSLPERLGDFPDDATVYVICKSGGRSMKACEFLESQGYSAVNVSGGTDAWIESGRATDSGASSGSDEPGSTPG